MKGYMLTRSLFTGSNWTNRMKEMLKASWQLGDWERGGESIYCLGSHCNLNVATHLDSDDKLVDWNSSSEMAASQQTKPQYGRLNTTLVRLTTSRGGDASLDRNRINSEGCAPLGPRMRARSNRSWKVRRRNPHHQAQLALDYHQESHQQKSD